MSTSTNTNTRNTRYLKIETMRPTAESRLRPPGLSDGEYTKWWLANQDAVARHAVMAAYKYAPERIGCIIANVGRSVERLSRDFALRNFRARSFHDYRCLHCGGDFNLELRGKFGWVCADTIRCATKAPNAPTRELTAPESAKGTTS